MRFVLKLACFGTIQLVMFACAEMRLAQFPNPYNIKKARLESSPNARVLLLGSSHVLGGLNPDELGVPAINLAGYSQDLYYDSQLVRQYLDRLPSLECVVFGLSYFSLEYDMEASSEEWRSCYYRRYFGIPHRHLVNEFDLRNYSLVFLYGPGLARQALFAGKDLDLSAFVQANGWAENPVPPDLSTVAGGGSERLAAHHGLMHEENLRRNLAVLDELLDVLHDRGIEVAFVTTPVHRSYSANFDPRRESRFHDAIRHLQSSYGARYFDFSNDPRFDARDFYNCDHLNRDGAAKLSRLFGPELGRIVDENKTSRLSSRSRSTPR
jgi:hypothetical protein